MSTVYLDSSCSLSSHSRLRWLLTAWKLSFHISQMMLLQRGLTLWNWIFNRQSHVFNYSIRHFCAQNVLRFTPPAPLHFPPISLFPPGTAVIAPTSPPPHARLSLVRLTDWLTDCVAAASAEITTQHPGRGEACWWHRLPLLSKWLTRQNSYFSVFGRTGEWGFGEEDWECIFLFFCNMLQIWMNSKQELKYTF